MQRCPQERENFVSHDRVERTQLETAARKIMEAVNTFNISQTSKDGILRAVEWIASKSRDNLDNTLTEFLSRQLCRVIDFVDSLIHFTATNRVETISDSHEVPLNVFPSNTFRRSVLLEAEADGVPAGRHRHGGGDQYRALRDGDAVAQHLGDQRMRRLGRRVGEFVSCKEQQDRQQIEQKFHGRGLCPSGTRVSNRIGVCRPNPAWNWLGEEKVAAGRASS